MIVSAIIVTRGDVDPTEPVEAIFAAGIEDVLLWDNGYRRLVAEGRLNIAVPDVGVYGRYAAIEHARGDLIYVQDDDAVVEPDAIRRLVEIATTPRIEILDADAAELEEQPPRIVANMPASRWDDYPDSCLVGWGAVFHRDLPEIAHNRWSEGIVDLGLWRQLRDDDPDGSRFRRTCDVVFTTLTPHIKVDLGFRHLPWAEGPGRMFTTDYASHKKERDEMLELARRVRDGR